MTSRAPIYNKDDTSRRICSMPNGKWQAQKFVPGESGTNKVDPWRPIGRVTSKEEARRHAGIVKF